MDELYELGFTSFLFLNIPPLDRRLGNVERENPRPNATQIELFKGLLETHADEFERARPWAEVGVFDAHAVLSEVLDHPARYGIVNTTDFSPGYDQPDIECRFREYGCPTPLGTYFWYNKGHMTSHAHEILATSLRRWFEG